MFKTANESSIIIGESKKSLLYTLEIELDLVFKDHCSHQLMEILNLSLYVLMI